MIYRTGIILCEVALCCTEDICDFESNCVDISCTFVIKVFERIKSYVTKYDVQMLVEI